ncbi:MAG: O-antigen ligase family protein [Candidatus Latescibacteria bacterium]|jgi:putative inorganic carbon (hco3(-)) transporter|nr:O-antigen ligase family protein [Candidatus Latescibacterota bacterium]
MNSHVLDINRGEINVWKIFWLLVCFEAVTLVAVLQGDLIVLAYYVGIVLTPLLLLLIPLEPTIGIILMLVATGFDFMARIGEQSKQIRFNLTYFHIALFVTFVSIFLNFILKRRTRIRSVNLWLPLTIFFIVLSYSLIYTPDFPQGSYYFVRIVVMGLLALIVIESVNREWKVSLVLWGMVLIPFAISILTVYQLFTEGAFFSTKVVKMATSIGLAVYRSTGTFENPNQLASFLMIGIIVPFGMLFIKRMNPMLKFLLVVFLLITSIGILSTFSRAGWISTLFGLMVIVALNRKWSFFYIFIGIIILTTVILSVKIPQLWEVIFDRFGSIFDPSSDQSSSSRISLIRTGIWMWQDHPLFGIGLRGFPTLYYDYVDPNMPAILLEVNEPHTIQVEILAEEGLIGFVVATWLFLTVFFHGLRTSLRMKNNFLRCAQIAYFALILSFIVNFTFATDITNNSFWISVGMIYAIPFIEKYSSPEAVTFDDSVSTAP